MHDGRYPYRGEHRIAANIVMTLVLVLLAGNLQKRHDRRCSLATCAASPYRF